MEQELIVDWSQDMEEGFLWSEEFACVDPYDQAQARLFIVLRLRKYKGFPKYKILYIGSYEVTQFQGRLAKLFNEINRDQKGKGKVVIRGSHISSFDGKSISRSTVIDLQRALVARIKPPYNKPEEQIPTISYNITNAGFFMPFREVIDDVAVGPYLFSIPQGEKVYDQTIIDIGNSLVNQGRICVECGQYDTARLLFNQLKNMFEEHLDPGHPKFRMALRALGIVSCCQGNIEEAEALVEKTIAIAEKHYGIDSIDVAYELKNMAEVKRRKKDYLTAESLFDRMKGIMEQNLPNMASALTYVIAELATMYREMGNQKKVEELIRKYESKCIALRVRIEATDPANVDDTVKIKQVTH